MRQLNLRSELTIGDILGHGVVWIVLSLVTFGFGLFLFPYYMIRFIIGRTVVLDEAGQRVGRLVCTIDLAAIIGNIILWAIISVLTLGVGYFIFLYKIYAHCISKTKIVDLHVSS